MGHVPFMTGGKDIELPNESGMVDPRVPAPLDALKRAFNNANSYATGRQEGEGALEALRKVTQR
jgi:hypothetical protein